MSDPFLIPVATPAAIPDSAAAGEHPAPHNGWQRQHISAFAFGIAGLARRLFDLVPAVAALGLSGNAKYIPFAAAAYLGLHLVAITLRWWFTRYRISDNSLSLRDGVLSRNERHIGFDRIQDVSIEQNFFARALGVARLSIETGAGGSGDDAALFPITLAKAQALRETLRAYRQQQSPSAVAADTPSSATEAQPETTTPETTTPVTTTPVTAPPVTASAPNSITLFTLPPRTLLLSGLFRPSLAIIAVFIALVSLSDRYKPLGYDLGNPRTWVQFARDYGLGDWFTLQQGAAAAHIAVTLAAITLAIALLALTTGIVRTIFRDWDYRLTREPRALRRTRGLTTRTDVAITIRRIQSATITSGLIRRFFGWHELRLRSLASDVGSGGDHQALPFARLSQVDAVLGDIVMRPDWTALDWQRSHPILALPPLLFGAMLIGGGWLYAQSLSPFGWAILSVGALIAILGTLGPAAISTRKTARIS